MEFKISGKIEAENEEEARYKATIEGDNGILEFEEVEDTVKCPCGCELMSFTCRRCEEDVFGCVKCGDSFGEEDMKMLQKEKDKK